MNYSTISEKTNCTEVEDISNVELSERYCSLKKQFDHLCISHEATKQELHATRRSYQTALDVQKHLTAELESHQSEDEKRCRDYKTRISTLQEDFSEVLRERAELAEQHANEIKSYELQINHLKEVQSMKVESQSPVKDNSELEEARSSAAEALSVAAIAKTALEEAKAEIVQWEFKTQELVNEVAEMRAAAELRREELRAGVEREAALMADLQEARVMLHKYTDSQDLQTHAAKGNSIFAEVEDKRQEMANNLIQMKQTNSRLRRELANKQAELDVLLHEKQTVWEQQTGAVAHYDRELIESYEERISQLEGLCEKQRRELCKWFKQKCTEQEWLPGVMEHLRTECDHLRVEVTSRGAAELAAAAQLRELRAKLARLASKPHEHTPTHYLGDDQNTVTDVIVPKLKNKLSVEDVKKKVSFN